MTIAGNAPAAPGTREPGGPQAGRNTAGEVGPLPGTEGSSQDPASLLTGSEHEAVRQAGLLYSLIAKHVVADGPTRDEDLAELRTAIHVIQRMVLAQAAARACPQEFRLLGWVVATDRPQRPQT